MPWDASGTRTWLCRPVTVSAPENLLSLSNRRAMSASPVSKESGCDIPHKRQR